MGWAGETDLETYHNCAGRVTEAQHSMKGLEAMRKSVPKEVTSGEGSQVEGLFTR